MRWMCLVVLAAWLAASPVRADQWAPASKQVVESPSKRARVTILPRDVANPLAYFTDASHDLPQPGQASGGATRAMAIVEVREGEAWRETWKGPLLNDVSPVKVMLSDDGKRLVTFDNWHSTGFGKHVIVVYGEGGKLIRDLQLSDFLPKGFIRGLPRSVSSMHWRMDQAFSADQSAVELKVAEPGSIPGVRDASVRFTLDLRDGSIGTADLKGFLAAAKKGDEIFAQQREQRRQWRAARKQPWPSPRGQGAEAWKEYESELKRRDKRLRWGTVFIVPAVKVEDYEMGPEDLKEWIGEIAKSEDREHPLAFGSVRRGEAAAVMLPALRAVPDKAWRGVTFYYIGEREYSDAIEAEVRRLGGDYHFIDVEKPLPPVPADFFSEEEAEEAKD